MVYTIIIFAILQISYNLLFKNKSNVLACGLFGAAADDLSKISIDKLKILGIFNDSRGGHSCGLAIDGDTIYGTDKQKLFKDFIAWNNIGGPEIFPVVMGHTRYSTGGSHTETNAHPFGFGDNRDYYHFMGAHNGTLHNHIDLAKKYGVSTTEEVATKKHHSYSRTKIDSEVLLEIIYKQSNFKVLEDYEGAAALAMYNTKKKNTLYLYHGASKKWKSDKELTEERPMFCLQAGPGILYYSSLKEALEAINDTDGEIVSLDCNIVYVINGGNLEGAKKIKINRTNSLSAKPYVAPDVTEYGWEGYDYTNARNVNAGTYNHNTRKWEYGTNTATTSTGLSIIKKYDLNNLDEHKKYTEEKDSMKDVIYYENLRFYKNRELLEGVYFVTNTMGLEHVCNFAVNTNECFEALCDDNNFASYKNKIFVYFVKGMMLRHASDFYVAKYNYNPWPMEKLSHMSVYPVRSLVGVNPPIYFRGEIANIEFTNFIAKHTFRIDSGQCREITLKGIDFDFNKKYYLKEDLEMFELITDNNIPETSKKEETSNSTKSDQETIVDLYSENIVATVSYCIDDTDSSIEEISFQSKIKTKLESIKEFVVNTLKL